MKPVNIYTLSMSDLKGKDFNNYYKYLSDMTSPATIKDHEINDMRKFVTCINQVASDISIFDGFYFSFIIPQISKEFDLIKITDNGILNIELKARSIDRKNILRQLRQNRHYCHHLAENIVNITCIAEKRQFFILNSNELKPISANAVAEIMKEFASYKIVERGIDTLFKPDMFLISPLNDSVAFIENEYFLTGHQEKIKKTIIDGINNGFTKNFCLDGDAGTGKTLLIYDIAKEISTTKRVLVIHSGKLCDGHSVLTKYLDIHIVSDKDNIDIDNFDVIFIDESHRMKSNLFLSIANSDKKLVFAIDSHQCTYDYELDYDIKAKSKVLKNTKYFRLTNTIRINKELSLFIKNLFNRKFMHPHILYNNVEIMNTENERELIHTINYFINKSYTFIHYSDDNSELGKALLPLSAFDTANVTGQEFAKVIMFVDERFFYKGNNLKSHNNGNTLLSRMLYQGLTRARESIAIIVYNNKNVYNALMDILLTNNKK